MQFLTQTTLIHQVRTNIAIIRSRVNQNINNLITKLTVHLNDRCLMIFMFVIQCCIGMWNTMTNIPNSLRLLYTVYLRPTTLILWKISLKVLLTACPQNKGGRPHLISRLHFQALIFSDAIYLYLYPYPSLFILAEIHSYALTIHSNASISK